MINQFRTLNPINIFLLFVVSLVLRIGVLVQMPERINFDLSESFGWLMITMPVQVFVTPVANIFIAAFLIILQAIILNRVINNHNILGRPTFMPALMYITGGSILMPFIGLNPVIICNFLVLWMINKFFNIYHRGEIGSVMYDLGMMVGVGTLIYFPFISMMPLLWISLIIFRPFNWREWVSVLLGFFTIYFFLAVFYYMNDSLDKFYQIWIPLRKKFPTQFDINPYDYIVLLPFVLIMGLSALSLRENFFRSIVQVRKTFQLLFFMFLTGILSFYLKPGIELFHFSLALAPAAIFMAYYFLNARKRWFYESLYLLLAGFIIYFQLF